MRKTELHGQEQTPHTQSACTLTALNAPDVSGFRKVLKHLTQEDHSAAEHGFGFDLTSQRDMVGFLRAQYAAISVLFAQRQASGPIDKMVADILFDLRRDLCSEPCEITSPNGDEDIHPLAAAYLVVGSRLGTEILRRQLLAAGHDALPRYFKSRDYAALWQGVCRDLDRVPVGSELAQRITRDVQRGFAIFLEQARIHRPSIKDSQT